MNYCEWVQGVIDELETQLKEDIDMETFIQKSFYSKSHFYRIFDAMIGVSIGEYIIKRRLSCAVTEVCMTKRRIFDIALDYGFASQEVFTRACQREFHSPPGRLRSHANGIKLYEKINVIERIEDRRDLLRDYRAEIVVDSGYTLWGYEAVVRPGSDSIKKLWQKFMKDRDKVIISEVDKVFGVCEFAPNVTENDDFRYYFGSLGKVRQNNSKTIKEIIRKDIPASKYVRIYYEPEKRSLKDTYSMFYGIWLPISGLKLEPKDTLEIYHLKNDCMEICIPVK